MGGQFVGGSGIVRLWTATPPPSTPPPRSPSRASHHHSPLTLPFTTPNHISPKHHSPWPASSIPQPPIPNAMACHEHVILGITPTSHHLPPTTLTIALSSNLPNATATTTLSMTYAPSSPILHPQKSSSPWINVVDDNIHCQTTLVGIICTIIVSLITIEASFPPILPNSLPPRHALLTPPLQLLLVVPPSFFPPPSNFLIPHILP